MATRWVSLYGVAHHLATYEILESLCKSFSEVAEFAEVGWTKEEKTGFKVKVKNCDVKKMPQFVPLVDIGGWRGSVSNKDHSGR